MSLEQAEKHALGLLADGLRQRFGTALWRVSLFGSKARGDDHPSSDIDVHRCLARTGCRERQSHGFGSGLRRIGEVRRLHINGRDL